MSGKSYHLEVDGVSTSFFKIFWLDTTTSINNYISIFNYNLKKRISTQKFKQLKPKTNKNT